MKKKLVIILSIIVAIFFSSSKVDLYAQEPTDPISTHLTPQEFKEELKGPIFSFPTAFTKTYAIDYRGIKNLIDRALKYGCKVFTLTSGNNMYDRLSFNEIKELTKLMVETVGDKGITIGATGNWRIDSVIDYVGYAESVGVDAVQVNPPPDANENISKTVQFYREVATSTDLGIVLHGYYSVDLLKQLIKIKSIVALKEDVPDLNYYIDRQIIFGKRLAIFSGGDDARYLFGYPYGSPAYFSTLYSYDPKMAQMFWAAIQSKKMITAVKIVTKYDLPFMKLWSRPFWNAAISYLGKGIIQKYIRPKQNGNSEEETLTEKELIKMQNDLRRIGLEPSKLCYTAKVIAGPPLPLKWRRGGQIGGKIGSNIIIAGGTNWSSDKTKKYWLKNCIIFQDNKWKPGPRLPNPIAYSMFACDNNGIYVAGGTDNDKLASDKVFRLISLNKGWELLPKLPLKLDYGAGAILKGKFYVTCGEADKGMTNRMWVLDLHNSENGWHECKSVPGTGRILPSMVTCGKYLYLLGGLAKISPLTPLKDAYQYDPTKDQWKRLSDLPLKGYAWVSQPIDSSHLIITGRAYGKVDKGVWVLNLKTMSMKKVGSDIVPAATAPLINVGNKEWWLIGGEPDSYKNRTNVVSVIKIKEISNCN